ncbi:MAG: hypothetical protein LBN23_03320 [Paludibacter sp.]|jgi:hypothetical protein|nr:hypothetical protein [Paludibacter sp.]
MKTKHNFLKSLFLLAFVAFALCEAQAGIIYVKPDGTGNGTSWADATGNIQAAITSASSGSSVYVASGIYKITTSLVLKAGVEIYGGFAGNETQIEQRQKTDLDGNGIVELWEFANSTVIRCEGNDRVITQSEPFAAVVDGFTISQGKATNGGGAYLLQGAVLSQCIVTGNTAASDGGGVYLQGATIRGCLVCNNVYQGNGGGVYAVVNSIIEGCKIENNTLFTGDVKIGDILNDGIVYSVDYTARTARIVSLAKAENIIWDGVAAQVAADFSVPDAEQMQKVYTVKDILNSVIANISGATFGSEAYWTSTVSGEKATQVIFDSGYAGVLDKTAALSVRGVKTITF